MSATRIATVLAPVLAIGIGVFYGQTQLPLASQMPTDTPIELPCAMVHTPMYLTKENHTFYKGASHMALMHNVILRGFNTIYQQAPHVQPEDYSDFIGYSLTWYKLVKSHHDDEEANLFPAVESIIGKKGIWDATHKEHEAFLGGLSEYHDYLSGLASPAAFSGARLVEIMYSFWEPFNGHFSSEIATIARLAELGDFPDAGPVFARWGKQSIMKAGYTDVVPFLFFNFDRTFEEGMWKDWPPMPSLIRQGLTRIGGLWHMSWWKFASCDVNGQPKALYAKPKE